MASDMMWGGLLYMTPSTLCTKYLHYVQVIPERCIEPGARYRARRGLVENVRGYRHLKKSLQRKLCEIEHDRKCAHMSPPQMSTSGVSASKLTAGHEYAYPMDPIYYHEKSCCFRNTYTRCPIFRRKVQIGQTEPRAESYMGLCDVRKKMVKNPSERLQLE